MTSENAILGMNLQSTDLFSVKGKVALVTGATSGIGLMIAAAFVARGARVYAVSRNAEACASIAAQLNGEEGCVALPGDVSSVAGIAALAESFGRHERSLDVLVNSAGLLSDAHISAFTEPEWDDILDVNLKAPFFLVQKLLPFLTAAASPHSPARVINIGSIGGLRVTARDTYAYAASKAGLHHLTRFLARKLGPTHITVNAIAPGPFPSRMMEITSEEMRVAMTSQIPLGRIGSEEDMAGAAVFFASPAGGYVTGAVLALDGGITA
jgi:NAD(P)-dependent dehydrogenase (short-subunit alcohol dehydrogenase family)